MPLRINIYLRAFPGASCNSQLPRNYSITTVVRTSGLWLHACSTRRHLGGITVVVHCRKSCFVQPSPTLSLVYIVLEEYNRKDERRHCLLRCFGDEYAIKDCLPACWLEFTNNMHCSSSVVISALIAAVSAHTTVWGVWVNGGQCSPFLWRSSEMTRYHLVDQGDGRNLYVHRFSSSPEVQYSYRDWADPLSSRQQSCQEHVIRCNGM